MMRTAMWVVPVLLSTMVGQAAPPGKPDAKAVLATLKGEWRQFEATVPPAKRSLAPGEGLEWWFLRPENGDPPNRSYLTDWDNEACQWVGELVLNVNADPMWLDYKYQDAGRERVWVGIVRFEGDDLRWVRSAAEVAAAEWTAAGGTVASRPVRFEDDRKRPVGFRLVRLKDDKAKTK